MKKEYRVVMEIRVNAESALDAAKAMSNELINNPHGWQYYVKENGSNLIKSVDLSECDDKAVTDCDFYQSL